MFLHLISNIINLNHPQHYYHWSFVTVSVANLVIILTMIVIFGLAILLPFPKSKYIYEEKEEKVTHHDNASKEDKKMWTYRLRHLWLKFLPPEKLLPDNQPAYVSSWIYVFGVATLAALFVLIGTGIVLSIGGVSWWHESTVGHFFNSMHLWSVELFMAFMVIHLWGKFWMAAWRGKRVLTWMTGVVAFIASILEGFTGYLSQQNFDSQWISSNGKDAINSIGLGSFFNLMNFGQMITWHIVMLPLALVFIVAVHIILVRLRGVSHPIEKAKGKQARLARKKADALEWKGPTRRYDILKEGTLAVLIVFILIFSLAALLSSPDEPSITVQTWSKIAPADFVATSASELAGTSETATYGQPYNNQSSNDQKIIFSPQKLGGVHQAIDSSKVFVILPLRTIAYTNPNLQKAINTYENASTEQQQAWAQNYLGVVDKVTFKNGVPLVPKADDGPVPVLVSNELSMAQSGAMDTQLLTQDAFYGSNYTKPLLFIEDGNYYSNVAQDQHLTGDQWGVMNETGSYPGQPWLWLYTLWYQIPQFGASANVDLIAIYLTGLATALLLLVPVIPGLRDIPKVIPIHRLIWRDWHKHKNNKN